jgi:VCBS repeat-containing protein
MPASPITFDLTGSVANAFSMSFVQNGLTLTVSSALYDGTYLGTMLPYEFSTPTLSMTSQGIGALNTYFDAEDGFDADGKFEMATLSFGQNVRVVSVSLIPTGTRYNWPGVDTEFVMFGNGLVRDDTQRQFIDQSDFINEVSVTGSFLGIGAVTYLDGFRIASITVELLGLNAVADTYAVKTSDAPLTLDVLANDTNAQQITAIDTTSLLGSVSLAADGLTLLYSAGSAFDYLAKGATATETFTYTVLGSDGTSQTQTVTLTVTGDPNLINGTAGNDLLNGTANRDVIMGLAGNDTIKGMGGNDDISGGLGKDVLYGNDGNDRVDGGDGDDFVYGDAGNDTVVGGAGNDRLSGGEGNDSIDGSFGADRLYGDGGNDVLTGSAGANILDGGTGIDTMSGGAGGDTYYVDNVDDQVIELALGGTDLVRSTASFTLAANVENLIIEGAESVYGIGNALTNQLTGNAGDNALLGLGGNDRLAGASGNDWLVGGAGRDIVTGGVGYDAFVFAEWGTTNFDTVTDFNTAFDTIRLSSAAFGLDVGAIEASEFGLGTKATTATQRLVYDQAHGDLYFDADGNGAGGRQLIASLVDGTVLHYDDIFAY